MSQAHQASVDVDLKTVARDVNRLLQKYHAKQLNRARAVHDNYARLWKTLDEVQAGGGKRFRPYLALIAYRAFGGKDYQGVLPAVTAIELLHLAILIHDDIIDRDYIRHGQPNVAGHYLDHYAAQTKQGDTVHFANSAALLAGDLWISEAYQLILEAGLSDAIKLRLTRLLGETIYRLGAGELLDTEAVLQLPQASDSLRIAELKTAYYTCVLPLSFGLIMAGGDEKTLPVIENIGLRSGVAFQLADDLLGMFGDEATTGKSAISDLQEGKRSYLMQQGLHLSNATQRRKLQACLGNPKCTKRMAEDVRRILMDCGAKQAVENHMRTYQEDAAKDIASLPIPAASKAQLNAIIDNMLWRSA